MSPRRRTLLVVGVVLALLRPTAERADTLLGCGAGAVVLGVLAASPVLAGTRV